MNDTEKRNELIELCENSRYPNCKVHEYEIPHTCYGNISEGGLIEQSNHEYIMDAFTEKKGIRALKLYGSYTLVVDLDTISDKDADILIEYIDTMNDYLVLDDEGYNVLVYSAIQEFCSQYFEYDAIEKAADIILDKYSMDIIDNHGDVYIPDNILDEVKHTLNIK